MVLVATSPQESAWGIAIHTAQRLAIETDPTWLDASPTAGAKGLKAARAIGMLTYRNYEAFVLTQSDNEEKLDDFKASSYISYQGEKLVKRFNVYSYWLLTKAMDSHNIARGRGTMEDVLTQIKLRTLIIGISSDFLCPVKEQKLIAEHIPDSKFVEIDSPYGHDGFLIEGEKIGNAIKEFLIIH
jgi:homoserine O-acetyltransferase